jgi:hypothetical protein
MGLYTAGGTRRTKTTVAKTAETDPLVVVTEDLYQRQPYASTSGNSAFPDGGEYTLFCRAGHVLRQSELDLLFPAPVVNSITPATGLAAGGTAVVIKGLNLDGVTAVTFDGVAATSVSVVLANGLPEVHCTTPAGSAGPADVAVTDDGGSVTKTAFFTYS